ncbi:acetyl-CoA C-acyltransferase [Natronospirillum operosum]|uniref:Acetyl-CoA C-acyltransferase n=1 Tax=Natronospirillum operosum TaxID=2759953 RepID=A0A4Z0WFU1_9GAMM|nr:acetyl-CoA C-acyltransferase [Natronospirillum operosum]TGG94156.1 acetyl-CoA C-acyltransferase [Natronospirillum operosum]
MTDDIVIVAARRTPTGALAGALSGARGPDLGATAIRAAVEAAGVSPDRVNEVIMGCVLPAGVGQAPARQAGRGAGLPDSTPCTTINKVCGSGMKATMLAHDLLKAGSADVAVAGGMESMSQSPYLLPKARQGMRMGHGEVIDHMLLDGLEDAYGAGLMGSVAQKTADEYKLTREDMDAFAIESVKRAQAAVNSGAFKNEIAPVTIKDRKGETVVDTDEPPMRANIDKIPGLRPAFAKDGTLTAANSSSISDGAAALVLMRASDAQAQGLKPMARIAAHATHARLPAEFTIAPIGAIQKALDKAGWQAGDVDCYEINEAFAMVTMLAQRELDLDPARVNVHGGACALGHPIGASGARILVTLLHALQTRGKKRGLASLCIGGGEATAMAVELL